MPGPALHVGATVMCAHGGSAQPVVPDARVRVSGQPALAQTTTHAVAGCALTGTPAPPCVAATWVSAAARVRLSGAPMLLQDSVAVCAPSGAALLVVQAQVRVRAQ